VTLELPSDFTVPVYPVPDLPVATSMDLYNDAEWFSFVSQSDIFYPSVSGKPVTHKSTRIVVVPAEKAPWYIPLALF
jgi:hypothetical protein